MRTDNRWNGNQSPQPRNVTFEDRSTESRRTDDGEKIARKAITAAKEIVTNELSTVVVASLEHILSMWFRNVQRDAHKIKISPHRFIHRGIGQNVANPELDYGAHCHICEVQHGHNNGGKEVPYLVAWKRLIDTIQTVKDDCQSLPSCYDFPSDKTKYLIVLYQNLT